MSYMQYFFVLDITQKGGRMKWLINKIPSSLIMVITLSLVFASGKSTAAKAPKPRALDIRFG